MDEQEAARLVNQLCTGLSAEERPLVESICRSAAAIVARERAKDTAGVARRDQHAKHHGSLWGYFDVLPNLPADLRIGLFAAGARYRAWIRFSNSASCRRSDAKIDGRGVAIKLLDVDGPRPVDAVDPRQPKTQDFVLLNHAAFFARDLREMAAIFEWLAMDRALPLYFVRHLRLRGAWTLFRLACRPNSPLELTYFSQAPHAFSQTPHALDERAVKYRLVPIAGVRPLKPTRAEKKSGDHLRHVLRRQLAPSARERSDAREQRESHDALGRDVIFSFEVQIPEPAPDLKAGAASKTNSIERSDVAWTGPFRRVAILRIPRQDFDHAERMKLAENMAFSVWNTRAEHAPLGSLNRARFAAYAFISRLRNDDNRAQSPAYTRDEWLALRALPAAAAEDGETVADVLEELTPRFAKPLSLLASFRALAAPLVVLAVILGVLYRFPQHVGKPVPLDGILAAAGFTMPSEALIPGAMYSRKYLSTHPDPSAQQDQDPVWLFRYGSVGAEFDAGIPYWVYRVLPRIVPDLFDHRDDWSAVGLFPARSATSASGEVEYDADYYADYHGLPRGLVLSDTMVTIGHQDYAVRLKRVALNCASCHRGEYLDEGGGSHFADGMPNRSFDATGYKQKTVAALLDPAFTVERVIEEIDRALKEEHARRGLKGAAPALNAFERTVYALIVWRMQSGAREKGKLLEWLQRRPENGPGRLDAFSALRFETLGFADEHPKCRHDESVDQYIATVDLPSIWRQGPSVRPRHHYDGNTADARARNVGAVVGIGGSPLSIRLQNVEEIGGWIDTVLAPPPYPFGPLDPDLVQTGRGIYASRCERCHGRYDAQGKLTDLTECMRQPVEANIGTDAARLCAVDPPFVEKLNAFGVRNGLWGKAAFQASPGYLCPPLDGIWARAPYLHNGSVPTLSALLSGERPRTFHRGNPKYDTENGGFVWNESDDRSPRRSFSTDALGDRAVGHDGEAQIVSDPVERRALIEYLYSL